MDFRDPEVRKRLSPMQILFDFGARLRGGIVKDVLEYKKYLNSLNNN